ncbi:hypothetical protein JKP88DRAFT_287583 [Tribonema minus]|uniref:HYDIN/VesB/CFA65-like Ig-like domain-containing protein n=1 Tax=Tribonema minus TaxID=303371 RepID=A0A835Z881_9STRA|nr:hypothetical protein JKP88DRAFT_287583 [Tribonema minus]
MPLEAAKLGASAASPTLAVPDLVAMSLAMTGLDEIMGTLEVKRVRIVPPASKLFSVKYEPGQGLAPGLDVKAQVTFQLPGTDGDAGEDDSGELAPLAKGDVVEYRDKLIIQATGGAAVEVPVVARVPVADVAFDDYINFGTVPERQRVDTKLTLTNTGSRAGKFRISCPAHIPLTFTPKEGVIRAGRSYRDGAQVSDAGSNTVVVAVEFDAKRWMGGHALRCAATLKVDGAVPRLVDVCAVIARQQLLLLSGEPDQQQQCSTLDGSGACASLSELDFGAVYYGGMREIVTILHNNGPTPTTYAATLHAEGGEGGTAGAQPPPPVFTIAPRQSTIPPHSQQAIRVRYRPLPPEQCRGFRAAAAAAAAASAATLLIENVELREDSVRVALRGRALAPALSASRRVLRFGACAAGERRDILVTLGNAAELPAACAVAAPPHFRASPARVVVGGGGGAVQLVVSFLPSQLGGFKGVVRVVAEGAATPPLEIRVMGTCDAIGQRKVLIGGTDKLPADFAPKFNFVKSQAADDVRLAATLAALHPWKRPDPLEETDLLATNSWDESSDGARVQRQRNLGATLAGPAATDARLTCSVQELARRTHHRHAYTAWLAAQRTQREARAAKRQAHHRAALAKCDPDDPEGGPDIGFERGLEGDAPVPDLPPELLTDSLFLVKRGGDGGDKEGGGAPKGHLHRAVKYKAQPSSQAEVRECANPIPPGQLATAVELSERVIEFGAVSSGAAVARALHVTNRLPHTVRFEFIGGSADGKARERLPQELSGTGPAVQIVPAGATALVDVALCVRATKEQAFRKQEHAFRKQEQPFRK